METAWIAAGLLGFGLLAEGLLHGRMLNVGHDADRRENPRSFWLLGACYGLIGTTGVIFTLAALL
jgi:hypothetical protein